MNSAPAPRAAFAARGAPWLPHARAFASLRRCSPPQGLPARQGAPQGPPDGLGEPQGEARRRPAHRADAGGSRHTLRPPWPPRSRAPRCTRRAVPSQRGPPDQRRPRLQEARSPPERRRCSLLRREHRRISSARRRASALHQIGAGRGRAAWFPRMGATFPYRSGDDRPRLGLNASPTRHAFGGAPSRRRAIRRRRRTGSASRRSQRRRRASAVRSLCCGAQDAALDHQAFSCRMRLRQRVKRLNRWPKRLNR